jgi:hypothetical protein
MITPDADEMNALRELLANGSHRIRRSLSAWRDENPDAEDDEREYLHTLAELTTTGIQRELNAIFNLKHDPQRKFVNTYVQSAGKTMAQHNLGIYLPYHKEIEDHFLTPLYTYLNQHVEGKLGTDLIGTVMHWAHTTIGIPPPRHRRP